MRLSTGDTSQDKRDEIEEFAKWILGVGNGKAPAISLDGSEDKDWVQIPSDLLIHCKENHIRTIVDTMYPDFLKKMQDKNYLAERSILAPTNECVHKINTHVLSSVPGKECSCLTHQINLLFYLHLYIIIHILYHVCQEKSIRI